LVSQSAAPEQDTVTPTEAHGTQFGVTEVASVTSVIVPVMVTARLCVGVDVRVRLGVMVGVNVKVGCHLRGVCVAVRTIVGIADLTIVGATITGATSVMVGMPDGLAVIVGVAATNKVSTLFASNIPPTPTVRQTATIPIQAIVLKRHIDLSFLCLIISSGRSTDDISLGAGGSPLAIRAGGA
jgi:hypothetical protein